MQRTDVLNKNFLLQVSIFKFKHVYQVTKTKSHKTTIMTTLCYGCENWNLNVKKNSKMAIDSSARKIPRLISR
jgi:hypothetical protein